MKPFLNSLLSLVARVPLSVPLVVNQNLSLALAEALLIPGTVALSANEDSHRTNRAEGFRNLE